MVSQARHVQITSSRSFDLNLNNPHVPGDDAYIDRSRLYWRTGSKRIWEGVQAEWTTLAGVGAKVVFMDEDRWVKNSWNNEVPPGYALGYEGEV